ncbi:MAG: GAF domain-containing protein [Anaerolineales bacterium]|nr:GAF domain-containing protein [Anaerolineales bacterium]
MAIIVSVSFSIIILIVMLIFGLYTRRNFHWVLLCLAWGASVYSLSYLLNPKALEMGVNLRLMIILLMPVIQQILVLFGVLAIVNWQKFDNLVDGAVYGVTMGLGYAAGKSIEFSTGSLETVALQVFSTTLVLATASGIIGVAMSQFYFQPKPRKVGILLGGLITGIIYTAVFNLIVTNGIGGNILPIAFGIGGITLVGLYVTGQLRKIIIQLGVEKKRAAGLLEIVIPIGVQLTVEKDFPRLLENMLMEAKSFCHADAGALLLRKDDLLEYAVVRNDALNIIMGGVSGNEVDLPPLRLYNEKTGKPNNYNVVAYAALSGKTVNIPDAYEDEDFDFSSTKEFDDRTGYASVSFLVIPLKNSQGDVQGVLQLLNAMDSKKKRLVSFDQNLQQLMESFSSLASAALEGYILEQSLRKEIQQLRIEIDHAKRGKQVEEITDTEYFQNLKRKTQEMREKKKEE